MIRTLQQYKIAPGGPTWSNPARLKPLAEYTIAPGGPTWSNPKSLQEYSDQSYPVPYFYPGAGSRGRTTLGDITPAQLAPNLPSGLATFASGITSSPWLYVGAGLLAWYLYTRIQARPTTITGQPRRRRRTKKITPVTAALYAAGAGAGGYMLGKYSGL